MTDEELIARLRQHDGWVTLEAHTHLTAADRIEELIAEREKDHANINLKADFIEKTLNQLAETEAKLAQAVEVLNALDATLDRNGWHVDSIAREDIRATLAEIKGETK